MAKETKTNAMRMLDSAGISYTVHTYDAEDGHIDGVSVAMKCNDTPNGNYIDIKPGMSMDQKVDALIEGIEKLKKELGVPASIKDWGVDEKEFLAVVDELSVKAFDDQCTGSNPRYPLISQIKQLYLDSFYGRAWKEEE